MKKSKIVKLVLITGLIGSAGVLYGNKLNHKVPALKGAGIIRGAYYVANGISSPSGSLLISRGGFGAMGHDTSAAS